MQADMEEDDEVDDSFIDHFDDVLGYARRQGNSRVNEPSPVDAVHEADEADKDGEVIEREIEEAIEALNESCE